MKNKKYEWSLEQLEILKNNLNGIAISKLSKIVHHKPPSIQNKLNELGLTLKPYKCKQCGTFVEYRCNFCNNCKNQIIIKHCLYCGQEIKQTFYKAHKWDSKYCSAKCAAIATSNSSWKNPEVHRRCIKAAIKTRQQFTNKRKAEIYEKFKSTMLSKYGFEHPTKSDKFYLEAIPKRKQTLNNRSEEEIERINKKIIETKKRNKSFNISKFEDEIFDLLLTKFKNIERQYRSKKYPFACDFYIPKLDLYIEIHGNWTHGRKPFDENDKDCLDQLAKWKEKAKDSKFYQNAIYTWTDLDVRKRNIAKQNNLNYLEFFTLEEVNNWIMSI